MEVHFHKKGGELQGTPEWPPEALAVVRSLYAAPSLGDNRCCNSTLAARASTALFLVIFEKRGKT
ncbi:hypothetical protein D5269_07430 [Anaerotruncus sp. 1XD42-93]|nr:hypothetical protein [Anaerotruncus sp. 1XD42-93]